MAGLGDLTGLFGKMKDMKANMQRLQDELAERLTEATSGGGMVSATVNGKGDVIELKIEKTAIDPEDPEMLEDLVKAAINAALAKNREMIQREMSQFAGGLNIPGMDQLGNMLG